ncbi:MAG: hypothetical protein AB1529_08515 [Candidatus Micrarchaeota archaeon]
MKDWLPAAAAVIVIIFFLLLTCGIVALLFIIPQPASVGPSQPNQTGPPGNATPPPGGNGTGQNISGEDLALWDLITPANVEDACLRRAREEAGESAELVYSCSCTESLSPGRKTFACDIDTADPFTRYFANVDCFLDGAACTIETNYGTKTVTFAELAEWYGK